jgi:hypothetical protein
MNSIQTARSQHLARRLEATQGLLVPAVAALSGAGWLPPAAARAMNLVALAGTDAWAAGTGSGPTLGRPRRLARMTPVATGVGIIGAVPAGLAARPFQSHARPGPRP